MDISLGNFKSTFVKHGYCVNKKKVNNFFLQFGIFVHVTTTHRKRVQTLEMQTEGLSDSFSVSLQITPRAFSLGIATYRIFSIKRRVQINARFTGPGLK